MDEFSKFLSKYFFSIESPLLGDAGKHYWTSFAAARWMIGIAFAIALIWFFVTTDASEVKAARTIMGRLIIGTVLLYINAPLITYMHGFFNTFSRFFVDPRIVSGDGLLFHPDAFNPMNAATMGFITLLIFVFYLILLIVLFFAQKFLLYSLTAVFVLMPLGIALYPFEGFAKYTKTFYGTYIGLLSILPVMALISGISMTKLMNSPLNMDTLIDACSVILYLVIALCGVAFAAIGSITKVFNAGN